MSEARSGGLRLDFGPKLPLIEAAVRLTLSDPIDLTFRLIFDLHEGLKSEFPDLDQVSEGLDPSPGISEQFQITPASIHGTVFAGHRDGISIKVQQHLLAVRWRRGFGESGPDYPRFDALNDALWRVVRILEEVRSKPAPIVVVNMSYANFVTVSDRGSVIRDYFAPATNISIADGATLMHKFEGSWREGDRIDVRFLIQSSKTEVDGEKVDGFNLTTAAGSVIDEPMRAPDTLVGIHGRLQTFFKELISDRAKDEWELDEKHADRS